MGDAKINGEFGSMLDSMIDSLTKTLSTPSGSRNFLNYLAITEPAILPRLLTHLLMLTQSVGADGGWRPTRDPAFTYMDGPCGVAVRCDGDLLGPDRQADGRPMDYHARLQAVHDWLKGQGILPADEAGRETIRDDKEDD
jgi:hypothetical protein